MFINKLVVPDNCTMYYAVLVLTYRHRHVPSVRYVRRLRHKQHVRIQHSLPRGLQTCVRAVLSCINPVTPAKWPCYRQHVPFPVPVNRSIGVRVSAVHHVTRPGRDVRKRLSNRFTCRGFYYLFRKEMSGKCRYEPVFSDHTRMQSFSAPSLSSQLRYHLN